MGYYSAPRRFLRGLRQVVYPRRCPFCGRVLGSIPECLDCAQELDTLRLLPWQMARGALRKDIRDLRRRPLRRARLKLS